MDDVIFAGTSNKSALGRAEVSLTIDNHSRTLPVEFNEVKITRTLFRSGDSEYSINGVPCRLLDITELLSDGGVGRQQHVIVSQGQIDAVLNARPEDRRSIIEEAAGVLKYRKRKDRAERRLTATDGDLTRVKDLMREVRRGLRPLEKQAEAARRHGDLIAELTALRIHLAGREVADLRAKLAPTASSGRAGSRKNAPPAPNSTSSHSRSPSTNGPSPTTAVMTSATPWFDWSRCESGLAALRRSSPNASAASSETARRSPIGRSSPTLRPRRRSAAATRRRSLPNSRPSPPTAPGCAAGSSARRRSGSLPSEWGDGGSGPERQSFRDPRRTRCAASIDRTQYHAESQRLQLKLNDLEQKRQDLEAAAAQQRAEVAALHDEEEPLVAALEAAETAKLVAENDVADRQAEQADAESEHHRWVARAEALTLALDEARARSGAARLAEVEGVLGTLLDLVAVETGWGRRSKRPRAMRSMRSSSTTAPRLVVHSRY